MKKFFRIFLLLSFALNAQTYQGLIKEADSLSNAKKDTLANTKKALKLYQKAFKTFPEKADLWDLYYAAYAANRLKKIDQAFFWLNDAANHYEQYDVTTLIDEDAQNDFSNLVKNKRWRAFEAKVNAIKNNYIDQLKQKQKQLAEEGILGAEFWKIKNPKQLYEEIKSFDDFPQLNTDEIKSFIKIHDSLDETFFVRIPSGYDPEQPSKVLIYLNGAVRYQQIPNYASSIVEEGFQRFYKKYAEENNIIMVYPDANKDYNWMLGDRGFFMVPAILRELKKIINVNDNQVFLTGHSNGATGSFNYLMKKPSEFAAFYGFNTRPKVFTGGTFIKNIMNRSFYNVSTDQDYYFPPDANDSLNILMKKIGADYTDHRYNGFPHWFPQFGESEPAFVELFEDLSNRKRNPFHTEIYWECDDVKNGKIDWLAITELDTLQPKKDWQEKLNFDIYKWLYYQNDSLKVKDTLQKAFDFPRKSGAISAVFSNNTFRIQTSRVKKINVFVSPEMVDMKKPLMIYVNDKKVYQQEPQYDREFMLQNFEEYYDRKALWVQKIQIEI